MIALSELAQSLGLSHINQDVTITGFSVDSRTVQPGDLFIALQGSCFDGHDYVIQAIEQGAAAVLVSKACPESISYVRVPDTQQALWDLAANWRQRFDIPIVAITGSCGKTSTRGLLQSILSGCAPTLASERSYNNHVGVPLTLLRLRDSHRYAVVEVGANRTGEVAKLVSLVKPHVSMITNVGPSHLSGFGNVVAVAFEKGRIFNTLNENDVMIVNRNDAFVDYWLGLSQAQALTFGVEDPIKEPADVSASNICFDDRGCASFQLKAMQETMMINLPLMGKHSVCNALAATAAAIALDIPLEKIKQGLEKVKPEFGRLVEKKGYAGATIIDDSYNANPLSVQAAVNVLLQRPGESVLLLGDMLELGDESDQLHREIGTFARYAGVTHLFCYGKSTQLSAEIFGDAAHHFEDRDTLLAALRPLLNEQMTVLVKGSNSMHMNRFVDALSQG